MLVCFLGSGDGVGDVGGLRGWLGFGGLGGRKLAFFFLLFLVFAFGPWLGCLVLSSFFFNCFFIYGVE